MSCTLQIVALLSWALLSGTALSTPSLSLSFIAAALLGSLANTLLTWVLVVVVGLGPGFGLDSSRKTALLVGSWLGVLFLAMEPNVQPVARWLTSRAAASAVSAASAALARAVAAVRPRRRRRQSRRQARRTRAGLAPGPARRRRFGLSGLVAAVIAACVRLHVRLFPGPPSPVTRLRYTWSLKPDWYQAYLCGKIHLPDWYVDYVRKMSLLPDSCFMQPGDRFDALTGEPKKWFTDPGHFDDPSSSRFEERCWPLPGNLWRDKKGHGYDLDEDDEDESSSESSQPPSPPDSPEPFGPILPASGHWFSDPPPVKPQKVLVRCVSSLHRCQPRRFSCAGIVCALVSAPVLAVRLELAERAEAERAEAERVASIRAHALDIATRFSAQRVARSRAPKPWIHGFLSSRCRPIDEAEDNDEVLDVVGADVSASVHQSSGSDLTSSRPPVSTSSGS
ncbi:hypothetical protein SLS56_001570 [Neofusicoccum ribis]|uniref:Transmembrane protein n=1 Tax=Neofusicoccum ribis TaxID=45134 RepID=A0ABR3T8K1_9PEZI